MPTERQQYSTHNQSNKIHEYTERHSLEINKTCADTGKSGLSIGGEGQNCTSGHSLG